MKIDYDRLISDSKELAKKIPSNKYKFVFGVPSGGILPASIIAQTINAKMLSVEEFNKLEDKSSVLIIDDLIDSGRTLKKYENIDSAVLYKKPHSPEVTYSLTDIPKEWVHLPHDKDESGIEDNIVRIFEHIGENPNREGLLDTPKRVAKMYKEIFRGYNPEEKPNITIFDNGKDGIVYDQMILDTGDFYSQCEHHMVPFFGKYYFAYIPDKKILGLSKVARIIDYYSAKLQIQERLVKEVVDELEKAIQPKGIALIMRGEHLCKTMRGAKKKGLMTTSELRGVFKESHQTKDEFLKLINI